MNVRIENIYTNQSPANYVSFLSQPSKPKGRSDKDSMHSISSIRSVMSNMTSFWSSLGIGSSTAKTEKAQLQLQADTKYLYSAFTKIPCLRLSPDHRARLISGYEEFPFDTAVPLWAFKNLSSLEIYDVDFRQFFGWDRLAEQLRSLTIKRGNLEDPLDLIVHIVLDDMDKRRRRSSKPQSPPIPSWGGPPSPAVRHSEHRTMSFSAGTSDTTQFRGGASPRGSLHYRGQSEIIIAKAPRNKSNSPTRPTSARHNSSYRYVKVGSERMRRSGSGSSNSSTHSLSGTSGHRSTSNLLAMGILPASKWRFLRHLSLADNSLTSLNATGLAPLANTLQSLDLSSNLFTEVPDCLATLTALRALNLANCMIESLHSLAKHPLPAIAVLNLRSNRLQSLAGIDRLFSLERVDVRENKIIDPMELARLTGIPDIRDIFVVGNPLTKLHSNYRITIFNLFRAAAGYSEDIYIDSTGPGYSERRQLKDRAAEPAALLVAKLPIATIGSPGPAVELDHIPSDVSSRIITVDRPIPHSVQSEAIVSSTRRRKSTKRRIVDLSADGEVFLSRPKRPSVEAVQQPPSLVASDVSNSSTLVKEHDPNFLATKPSISVLEADPFISQPVSSTIEDTMTPPRTPQQSSVSQGKWSSLVDELENLKLSGNSEAYQQRLESIKTEHGSVWLQISNNNNWPNEYSAAHNMPHNLHPSIIHTSSQGTVGRTLG